MTCKSCSEGEMHQTEVPRGSGGLLTIGYAATIGAVLMLGVGTGWGLATMGSGPGSIDWLSGVTKVALVWILSSPFLIIGVALVFPKKTVWRCQNCDYIFDRASG